MRSANVLPRSNLRFAKLVCSLALLLANTAWSDVASRDLTLRVWLGDREIGQHEVSVQTTGATTRVATNVSYQVKILFVSVFKYTHTSEETWLGHCLTQIDSSTLDNGTQTSMQGRAESGGFKVRGDAGLVTEANPCVGTYAYWDMHRVQRDALLNTQTGSLDAAKVTYVGEQQLPRLTLSADAYEIEADDSTIQVWYSTSGEWLALETMADDKPLIYLNKTLL